MIIMYNTKQQTGSYVFCRVFNNLQNAWNHKLSFLISKTV